MYAITADSAQALVKARLAGFMSVPEVETYLDELRVTMQQPAFRFGYLLMLDASEAAIQSQDVVGAFQRHMPRFPKARRIAIVHPGHLARMQIRRVFGQPYARVVGNTADGQAWLLHATEPAAEASVA